MIDETSVKAYVISNHYFHSTLILKKNLNLEIPTLWNLLSMICRENLFQVIGALYHNDFISYSNYVELTGARKSNFLALALQGLTDSFLVKRKLILDGNFNKNKLPLWSFRILRILKIGVARSCQLEKVQIRMHFFWRTKIFIIFFWDLHE